MNSKGWMASLMPLPIVIDGKGMYKTRSGEKVFVQHVETDKPASFNCYGFYENEVPDRWHRSGRLYFNRPCDNDIVEKVKDAP